MRKKKWKPVPGETFYFIHASDMERRIFHPKEGESVDLNCPDYDLVIGDAECYDPDFDTTSNCFRTKGQAKKAIAKIKAALKFTGA